MTASIVENPAFQHALRNILEERVPFCRLLGFKLRSFDPERPQIEFAMREDLVGNFTHAMLHGGVIAAVLDTVAGFAVLLKIAQQDPKHEVVAQLQEFSRMSTIDMRIDYLLPGRGKSFVAGADVTRLGKRVANVQMTLHNDEGERVATGAAAFMLHAAKP